MKAASGLGLGRPAHTPIAGNELPVLLVPATGSVQQ